MTKEQDALRLAQRALSNRNASPRIIYKALFAIQEALAEPETKTRKANKKHEPTIDLGKYAGTYGGYIK